MEPYLPEYDQIFRTFMKTSPNNILKLDTQIKEIFGDEDIDKIRMDKILKASKKRFDYSKEKNMFNKMNNQNPEEFLEKFVILSHLIDNDHRIYLQAGQNPFNITIFNEMFKSHFGSTEEIYEEFLRLNQPYSLEFHKLQNMQLKNLASFDKVSGRKQAITCNFVITFFNV